MLGPILERIHNVHSSSKESSVAISTTEERSIHEAILKLERRMNRAKRKIRQITELGVGYKATKPKKKLKDLNCKSNSGKGFRSHPPCNFF